jgi:hypothetical protein
MVSPGAGFVTKGGSDLKNPVQACYEQALHCELRGGGKIGSGLEFKGTDMGLHPRALHEEGGAGFDKRSRFEKVPDPRFDFLADFHRMESGRSEVTSPRENACAAAGSEDPDLAICGNLNQVTPLCRTGQRHGQDLALEATLKLHLIALK